MTSSEKEHLRGQDDNYHFIFEQATDAIMVTDFRGNFKNVNSTFCSLFGYSKEELLHMNIRQLLDAEHLLQNPMRFDLLEKGVNVFNERKMVDRNGSIVYVEANVKKFTDSLVLCIARNISERKRVEQTLQKSEANLHTIFDNTDTIYFLMDNDLRIISWNHRAEHFAKMQLGRAVRTGEYIADYFGDEKRHLLSSNMAAALNGQTVGYEINYQQKDGWRNWYQVRMFPISRGDQHTYGLITAISNITETKLLERRLLDQKIQEQKKIIRAVLNAQEVERNKLGQELHDNISQILASVKICIDAMINDESMRPELLERTKEFVDTAIKEIRLLSKEQVTPRRKFDLKEAIEELIDSLNEHANTDTKFQFNVDSALQMEEDLKLNIYRIVQEQVNNILKYASAKEASISIHESAGDFVVMISDDGKGFDPKMKRRGIGISNMINRVESYNGQVKIDSHPGEGSKIEIRIPY